MANATRYDSNQETNPCHAQDVNAEPDGSGSGSALPPSDQPACSQGDDRMQALLWAMSQLNATMLGLTESIQGMAKAMLQESPQPGDEGDAMEVTGTDLAGRPLPRG